MEPLQSLNKKLEKFKNLKILVVGDIMLDRYLFGTVSRISPEAPVPIVNLEKSEDKLGGAANVAYNIASLGSTPILCSMIGNDDHGKSLKAIMKREGLTDDLIFSSQERPTTVKSRILAGSHQLLRIDHETTEDLTENEEDLLLDKMDKYLRENNIDAIVLQDYNKGILTKKIIQKTIKKAEELGIPSLVDPKKKNFWEYKGVTVFKPNLREINDQLLSKVKPDKDSLGQASLEIKNRLQNSYTVITLSEYGIYGNSPEEKILFPTKKRKIADVCGAGDSVISILAVAFAAGIEFKDSLMLANIGGGQVCEYPGVVPVELTKLVSEFLND
ncbi:MAG: hypothetical protein RJA52_119 [Bacteroidota bacterium]